MACPRSLADGCVSATSFVVVDVDYALTAFDGFMRDIGSSVQGMTYSRTCSVAHPDGLECLCKAEVFRLPAGAHLLELTRLKGDAVLFALVLRLLRAFISTGQQQEMVRGQLFKRCRLTPASDPAVVPPLALPPLALPPSF